MNSGYQVLRNVQSKSAAKIQPIGVVLFVKIIRSCWIMEFFIMPCNLFVAKEVKWSWLWLAMQLSSKEFLLFASLLPEIKATARWNWESYVKIPQFKLAWSTHWEYLVPMKLLFFSLSPSSPRPRIKLIFVSLQQIFCLPSLLPEVSLVQAAELFIFSAQIPEKSTLCTLLSTAHI